MNMTQEQIEGTHVQPTRREPLPAGELAALHSAISRAQMITADAAFRLRQQKMANTAAHALLYRIAQDLGDLGKSLEPTVLL